MRKLLAYTILSVTLGLPYSVWAGPFDNSLWMGTGDLGLGDTLPPVLNTDLAGNALRRVNTTLVTGIAIDRAANRIYFGLSAGEITSRDLNNPVETLWTLNPMTQVGADMAFDGTFLWRADAGDGQVKQIDPNTGTIHLSFNPGSTPLGVA